MTNYNGWQFRSEEWGKGVGATRRAGICYVSPR